MISNLKDCFYVVRAEGEAATCLAPVLSESILSDIKEVILISKDYNTDIEAEVKMEQAVNTLKSKIEYSQDGIEQVVRNPLYYPVKDDALDAVLEDGSEDSLKFVGMDGSPFTIKSFNFSLNDNNLIQAKVSCKPFDLPTYSDIVKSNKEFKYN
jgi:hypothetical protein